MSRINRRMFMHACAGTLAGLGLAGTFSPADAWSCSLHPSKYPRVRFAVLPDLHFYDPELGTEGPAFEEKMMDEIKLFNLCEPLLERALTEIANSNVDFLLIPGDLTKDGELSSHERLADHLDKLRQQGIQVFVVPGNHDISNPEACFYTPDGPLPTETVSPEEFEFIYRDFGYDSAIFRDNNSLSYVVEPVPGLWLLGIDSCHYDDTPQTLYHAGSIQPGTLEWIKNIMDESRQKDKAVIGFLHHAVLENFNGHAQLLPDYIIENHDYVSRTLAGHGLQMVFTGHTHSQDIRGLRWDKSKLLLDIQTGALVTHPNPYRVVSMRHGFMRIKSHFIKDLPGYFQPGEFSQISRAFSEASAARIIRKFGLRGSLKDLIVKTYLAHVQGDEQPSPETLEAIAALKDSPWPWRRVIGQHISEVWNNPTPSDNDLFIYLPDNNNPLADIINRSLKLLSDRSGRSVK